MCLYERNDQFIGVFTFSNLIVYHSYLHDQMMTTMTMKIIVTFVQLRKQLHPNLNEIYVEMIKIVMILDN